MKKEIDILSHNKANLGIDKTGNYLVIGVINRDVRKKLYEGLGISCRREYV